MYCCPPARCTAAQVRKQLHGVLCNVRDALDSQQQQQQKQQSASARLAQPSGSHQWPPAFGHLQPLQLPQLPLLRLPQLEAPTFKHRQPRVQGSSNSGATGVSFGLSSPVLPDLHGLLAGLLNVQLAGIAVR